MKLYNNSHTVTASTIHFLQLVQYNSKACANLYNIMKKTSCIIYTCNTSYRI